MKKMSLNEMKSIQIEMLKYIDKVCQENNIDYFLIGGSLLGAIRHNGFIPWDDDIDIGLTKENFDKLYNLLSKNNNTRYQFFDHSLQEDYYYPFAKLIDTWTCLNENQFKNISNYGIYIDIFTYFNMPVEEELRMKHYKKLKNLQRKIFYYSMKNPFQSGFIKNILKAPFVLEAKLEGIDKILKKYNKLLQKYNNVEKKYLISNWPVYKPSCEIQQYDMVKKVCYHKFENIEALIPKEYDKFLKKVFGNYMELPPKEKRVSHHDIDVFWKDGH